MIKILQEKLEKIIRARSYEVHKLRVKINSENYSNDISEIRRYIKNDNNFKLLELIVLDNDFVILSVKWKGSEIGNYYVY